jgi:predicted nucleic acid-binding protein
LPTSLSSLDKHTLPEIGLTFNSNETHPTEILALARTLANPLLLLDDEVARSEARRLKLRICGTLGLLVQAYREKLLSFSQVELLIREIAVRPDIWIGARLCEQVLASLCESDS